MPLPASVAKPTMRKSVKLPTEFRLRLPVFVTVPCKRRNELLTTLKVPVLAKLAIVAVLPLVVVNWPVSVVARVPPLSDAPPLTVTTPPLMALSTPVPVWPKVVGPVIRTFPASARTKLLLLSVPVLENVSALLRLPSMVPLLVRLNCVPAPIWPAPCRVWPLPKVRLSPAATA